MPWAARLAIVAMLIAALAPTITRAMAAENGRSWAEICSVQGTLPVAVADAPGQTSPDTDPSQMLDACRYCTVHADGTPLPPMALALPPMALPSFIAPEHAPADVPARTGWLAAQPRAPPALA